MANVSMQATPCVDAARGGSSNPSVHAPTPRVHWQQRPWVFAACLWCLVHAAWLTVAIVGTRYQFDLSRYPALDAAGRGFHHTPQQALDIWARWDALFYLRIAQEGYGYDLNTLRAAFFPVFPLCIRAVTFVTFLPAHISGLILANLFDCLSWMALATWLFGRTSPGHARLALILFALFPTRNFGFSIYTEGLFGLLSVGAFLLYERRRWGWAAWCCAVASAVRPQGICLGIALLVGAWQQTRAKYRLPTATVRQASVFLLSPLGLVAYMCFLHSQYSDPLAFLHVQRVWARALSLPWTTFVSHGPLLDHVALWVALGLAAVAVKQRVPFTDVAYIVCSLLMPVSSGRILSMARFVGMLFPMFLVAATVLAAPERRRFRRAALAAAVIFSCVMAFKVGQGAKVI